MKLTLLFFCGMLLSAPLWATGEVIDIPAHSGGTQRLLLLKPEQPTAILVVFAGDRALGIRNDGSLQWGTDSLLIRTSPLFVRNGFIVVIVDIPSARQAQPMGSFRRSADHAQDIAAVIQFLRQHSPLPIWLIGVSGGTTSVLNAAIRLQENGADGIILTSGISGIPLTHLAAIRVPTLLMRKGNPCPTAPQDNFDTVIQALTNAPKAEERIVQSSVENGADPCNLPQAHGFIGLEQQLVDKISDWIKAGLYQHQHDQHKHDQDKYI